MPKTTVSDTIILVDDEPHNMLWMADYIDSKGLYCQIATNINEAIQIISEDIYRAVIVDLTIPALPPLDAAVEALGPVYTKYPGLFVAKQARTKGYRDRQVVIYSVHSDMAIADEADRLGCRYILKGRPKMIQEELSDILSYDPTQT
jgi:CheY-like chemotaxis protein